MPSEEKCGEEFEGYTCSLPKNHEEKDLRRHVDELAMASWDSTRAVNWRWRWRATQDQLDAVRVLIDTLDEEVERAARYRESKGGQHVPYHGHFASAPHSTLLELRRWVEILKAASTKT